jgi:crossover junction endodeoxyribonuclease RuvC
VRILGIDPGYATVGYGIVDTDGYKFSVVGYGAVTTPANHRFEERLKAIYDDIGTIIDKYKPEALSIEKLYFNTNSTTAIDVAQARGVIVMAAHSKGLNINEYTPLQVKQAVTGYGRAEKFQVMEMVKTLLSLEFIPKPDDAADALALALCHGHYIGSTYSRIYLEAKQSK